VLGAALFDLLEGQLLVLVLRGVQGRTGVAAVEIGVAFRLAAVVLQLQVQRRRHRHGAEVGHVVAHADHVVAAVEGEGLGQAHAALLRFEHELGLVAAVEGTSQGATNGVLWFGRTPVAAGVRPVCAR
jgi:hypothetical protein